MLDKNFWRNRNVFVTGATGLLGSWLTIELAKLNANVTILVRDLVPKSNLNWTGYIDKVNVVRGNLEDYLTLERALNEYEIDTVFHLGAQTIVQTANRSPLSTFESNIKGTWNLLEAARHISTVNAIVVASSDKAYGEQKKLPYTEETPLKGTHPYDVSKSCADLVAGAYFETYKLPICTTRCGNFYGGGDLNFNRLVPGTIRSAIFNESPIIRSDGTYIRDYFYVKDGVYAYLYLAEKMRALSISGESFNFSNETQTTVIELAENILELMGRKDLRPKILDEARGEIKHQYLSAEKARRVLGWKPQYNLKDGLEETIDWYKKFFGAN